MGRLMVTMAHADNQVTINRPIDAVFAYLADGDYKITTAAPPHRLEFQVTAGPARPTGRFELTEPSPGTTEVTFTLDFAPTGLMRLMNGMITKTMRHEVAQLSRLK